MYFCFLSLVLVLSFVCVVAGDGCKQNWEVSVQDNVKFKLYSCDKKIGPFPAKIPGDVHLDLMNANIIKINPYYRFEEKNLSWVVQQCWVYQSDYFSLPGNYDPTCDLRLRMKGVDAVGIISINGQKIFQTVNAHREHDLSIPSSALKLEDNVLTIELQSALTYTKQQASQYPYVVPATENYNVWAEPTSRNFLRKAGSDFGWDWGPAFVNTGLTNGLILYQSANAKLDGMAVEQFLSDNMQHASLDIRVSLSVSDFSQKQLPLQVMIDGRVSLRSSLDLSTCKKMICMLNVGVVSINNPELWWPRGYGEQKMYSIQIQFLDGSYQSLTRNIGLRKVQLVQQPIPNTKSNDISFYITINNRSIFMRGANFIPIDSFHSRVTHNDRSYIFHAAAESNMNMLRVWGGGIYQPDDFYDLADKFGIMIWQEIMLACALYPRNEAFLLEVEEEVRQQSLRLGTHPSIVVWGGNNEDEVALNWFQSSQKNRDLYVADYSKLYADTVFPALMGVLGKSSITSSIVWVDSSPSNGLISTDPYVKIWGQASTAQQGDVHFYDYSCDCEDFRSFPEAKFVSEFGFQTMPSFQTYESVLSPSDYDVDSPLLQFRQRHEDGNNQMQSQIIKHFSLPVRCSSDTNDQRSFDMYLYLVGIQQSRCYETAMNRWRQLRGMDNDAKKYTMGILYWQMNDIWQGPSWASIEYGGRWKPLQYAVKRVFDMISLSISYLKTTDLKGKSSGLIEVFVVNDILDLFASAEIVIELKSWKITSNIKSETSLFFKDTVIIAPERSNLVTSFVLDEDTLSNAGCNFGTCYIKATAAIIELVDPSGKKIHAPAWEENVLVATTALTTMKDTELLSSPHAIFSNFHQVSDKTIQFDLTINVTSPFLFLEYTNEEFASKASAAEGVFGRYAGWFSDNNFVAEGGETYRIAYTSFASHITMDDFQKHLQGRSLQHVYDCNLPFFRPSY